MLIEKIDKLSLKSLSSIIILAAIIIAAQIQYIQHGWINPDSVLYLESAKLLAQAQWKQAFEIFSWPLYSLCIAGIHKLTSLNIHHSAQLASVVFFGLTCASFLKIIELAGGKQRQLVAGGLVLLSAQYLMGGVLEMLMRDQGFWAFYLLSLVFFIQFYKKHQLHDALFWQISIIVAVLFRIEAITYLLFLPFILLFDTQYKLSIRMMHLIKCNLINIAFATGVGIYFLINVQESTQYLGRLNEVFNTNIINQLIDKFIRKSSIMSSEVLGDYLKEFAIPGLILTFIYVMVVKAVSATGIINVALASFAFKAKHDLIDKKVYKILCATAFISIINMALIITKVFVLSGRYVLALSFILMIFAAFYLALLFKYLDNIDIDNSHLAQRKKWFVIALLVIMTLGAIKNILPKHAGYNHIQDAVAWVKNDNTDNKPIFYDDTRARYYAGEKFEGTWDNNWIKVTNAITDKSILQYDYLIINLSSKEPEKQELLNKQLSQYKNSKTFFDAKKKKYTIVYKKRDVN